eukprot:14756678-Ditylum_brightwellii.AAC.1
MAGSRKGISGRCSRTYLIRSDINRGANHALCHQELLPRWMTGGNTTLLCKKGDESIAKNY